MFLFDLIVDLLINAYVSLGYGTPQRKINVKIDKVSKNHPKIKELYEKNRAYFEEDSDISNLILESKVNTSELKNKLAERLYELLRNKNV